MQILLKDTSHPQEWVSKSWFLILMEKPVAGSLSVEYLTKIAREFKADPIGFGKYYRKKVLTLKELENIEWKEIFPNSEFKTEFQIHLNTTQMVSNQISK